MEIVLSAKNLCKTYQTASGAVLALNDVSLEIEKGLFHAIIGRSGSGKSTLLHILSGLDRPTGGSVWIERKNLFEYSDEQMAVFRRRHMGFIFQQYNLLEDYNILTNICMPLKLDGRKANPEFLREITEFLGISKKLKRFPSELSGGEQQRAAIARALLAKPKLIFADEPTGNLDKSTGEDTMRLLHECCERFGQTLILVTHDLAFARTSDKLIHLEDGKIL